MRPWLLGSNDRYGTRPRPEHERLLRAALLAGDAARDAYRAWRGGGVSLDALDGASLRLLPLLARNLRALGVQDPDDARLRGYHRHAWTANQLLLHRAGEALRALAAAGIDALVLKGAGLVARGHYEDAGLRPMGDVDILVPCARARDAMAVLRGLGLQAAAPFPERLVDVLHATVFAAPAPGGPAPAFGVDLHWHVLPERCLPGDDDDLRAAAVPARVGAAETRTLCPADMLLHVCVHGTGYDPSPAVRWVADAMAVLRSPRGEVDWDRLVERALAWRLALRVREALGYLRERLDAPVPDAALARLLAAPVTAGERVERWARARPPRGLPRLVSLWLQHDRRAAPASLARRLAGFPRFLQHVFGVARLRDLPLHFASKLARRLRRRIDAAVSRAPGSRGTHHEEGTWIRERASA